jgi:hypothetical protein
VKCVSEVHKNAVTLLVSCVQGGIFHGDDDVSQIAFRLGIERINSESLQYWLNPKMRNISRTDSFNAQRFGKLIATDFSSQILINFWF